MAVWQDKFININPFSRSGKKITAIKKVVIHYTANNGATANGHFNYFNTLKDRYASAHFFVDKIEALCIIPLSEIAYHANDGTYRGIEELKPNANYLSVGIEMCMEKDGSIHPDTIKRTEDVAVELCKRYKLNPLTDIVRHYDVTHKNCPAPWVSNASLFTAFKGRVDAKLKSVTTASTYKKPAQATGSYPTGSIGKTTIIADALNVREGYTVESKVLGQVLKGETYFVYKEVDGWLLLGNGQWISGGSGKYASLVYRPVEPQHMYRVRLSWEDAESQKGAFENLDSAKALADANKGYKVFDETGKLVYPIPAPQPAPIVTQLYRVRKSWDDDKSQIGAFVNIQSAKELVDQTEGYKVFDVSGKVVYVKPAPVAPTPAPKPVEPTPTPEPVKPAPAPVAPVAPVETHEGHHDIMGKATVEADKMVAFVKTNNPNAQDLEEIAKAFISVGEKYGVRGDVAFVQSLIETGWFKFDGGTAVTPDQHNYCGLGVTSKGMKGNSFPTVVEGVTAQIQHLFAYASKDAIPSGETLLDPRFKYVTRGIAPHWEDLSNRWAMNVDYGKHIMSLYDRLVSFEYVPPVVVEEPVIVEQPEQPQPEVPVIVEEPKAPEQSQEEKAISIGKMLVDYLIEQLKKLFKL